MAFLYTFRPVLSPTVFFVQNWTLKSSVKFDFGGYFYFGSPIFIWHGYACVVHGACRASLRVLCALVCVCEEYQGKPRKTNENQGKPGQARPGQKPKKPKAQKTLKFHLTKGSKTDFFLRIQEDPFREPRNRAANEEPPTRSCRRGAIDE